MGNFENNINRYEYLKKLEEIQQSIEFRKNWLNEYKETYNITPTDSEILEIAQKLIDLISYGATIYNFKNSKTNIREKIANEI